MFTDQLGKEITVGSKIAYPPRPGGKGPLELAVARVTSVDYALGEITVEGEYPAAKPVRIKRHDRVAVVA